MGCRSAWLPLVVAMGGAPPPAVAREYGLGGVIECPEDVQDLQQLGAVDPDAADALLALLDRPLDVNRAGRGLLEELPGVTEETAAGIVAWRSEHGAFTTIEELLRVPGMTGDVWESIVPFVTVAGPAGADDERPVRGTLGAGVIWAGGAGAGGADPRVRGAGGPQGFVRARATGYGAAAGLLATFRELTTAAWDRARGQLVTAGPSGRLELDDAYVTWGAGPWRVLAGSFEAGFAERLTLDTTSRVAPSGFGEVDRLLADGARGTLRVQQGLFGLAASLAGIEVPGGWLDATVVASRQRLDVGQARGIWWGYDDGTSPACGSDADCKPGYACDGVLGICHSSSVYDAGTAPVDPVTGELAPTYRFVTFDDAVRESLVGGNVTLGLDEDARVGITAYRGWTEILLGREARPSFAPSARWPRRGSFGAVGASGRGRWGRLAGSAEVASTGGGGWAAYARGVASMGAWGEVALALRWYDPRYENPHGRGEAEPDLEGGLAARNELGARLVSLVTPVPGLRIALDLDLWRPVRSVGAVPDEPAAGGGRWSARARGRVTYALGPHETAFLLGQATTHDLGPEEGAEAAEPPAPARRSAQIGAWTSRLRGVRLQASASMAVVDPPGDAAGAESRQIYRVKASGRAWPGGTLSGALAVWRHGRPAAASTDRREPAWTAHLALAQELGSSLWLGLRYGLESLDDGRRDRSPLHHVGEASIAARL